MVLLVMSGACEGVWMKVEEESVRCGIVKVVKVWGCVSETAGESVICEGVRVVLLVMSGACEGVWMKVDEESVRCGIVKVVRVWGCVSETAGESVICEGVTTVEIELGEHVPLVMIVERGRSDSVMIQAGPEQAQ